MKTHTFFHLMLIILPFILIAPHSHATDPHFGLPAKDLPMEYQQKGSLISIKIVPKNKETRLYLVGHDIAIMKVDEVAVTGKLKLGKNEKIIQFRRKGDYFTTQDKLSGNVNIKLEMLNTKKTEEFNFKIKKVKP